MTRLDHVFDMVHSKLDQVIIEDPLSATIRSSIAQGFNVNRLPEVGPFFTWEFSLSTRSYFLKPSFGPPIFKVGIEWVTWLTPRALHQFVYNHIEQYYNK